MSASKPERMVWDDTAHLRLLLTIIAQHEITPNYKEVAAAFGEFSFLLHFTLTPSHPPADLSSQLTSY
jgi:hypothetical protein